MGMGIMGMRIPIPIGFSWDSHGNGSSFGLLGIVLMGMEISYFISVNKMPTGNVNSLMFLHSNMQ